MKGRTLFNIFSSFRENVSSHWATGKKLQTKSKTKTTKLINDLEAGLINYEREIDGIYAHLSFLGWAWNESKRKFEKIKSE